MSSKNTGGETSKSKGTHIKAVFKYIGEQKGWIDI